MSTAWALTATTTLVFVAFAVHVVLARRIRATDVPMTIRTLFCLALSIVLS